jgi:fido (protein-threonine AMPylation protein)
MGETQMVIQEGLTISGKPLKDTIEVHNLNNALEFFETLVKPENPPISLVDLRNIHSKILHDLDDRNAGRYRSVFVEISGSKYRPPDPARIETMMADFGEWLGKASDTTDESRASINPIVLACAAHAWFVYIHPFIDGNGRTARLLMNLLLMRHRYPLTILTKDDRQRYYDALEESQGGGDLTPFIQLVMEATSESLEIYEEAAKDEATAQAFVAELIDQKISQQESKYKNEYAVFESAMQLFKGYFRQTAQMLDQRGQERGLFGVFLKDFGALEFEKYQSIRLYKSAKRTWFFRLSIYNPTQSERDRTKRYLFFFGYSSLMLTKQLPEGAVVLHIAVETEPFVYDRLSDLKGGDYPNITEIGYLPAEEKFIYLDRQFTPHKARAEEIARLFIQQAIDRFGK